MNKIRKNGTNQPVKIWVCSLGQYELAAVCLTIWMLQAVQYARSVADGRWSRYQYRYK